MMKFWDLSQRIIAQRDHPTFPPYVSHVIIAMTGKVDARENEVSRYQALSARVNINNIGFWS